MIGLRRTGDHAHGGGGHAAGMDRLTGAPDALAFVRSMTRIEPPEASFDSAFSS